MNITRRSLFIMKYYSAKTKKIIEEIKEKIEEI